MKTIINQYIDNKMDQISQINEQIWDYAEIGLEEMKSVALYEKLLKEEGFNVTTDIAGMPTAFVAEYGSGKPVIGITAEYDALPQLSQEAGKAEQSPIVEGGHGHGCGHNSLGAAAFGGALAVKEYLKNNHKEGTIKLFGCPSEEKDNGKAFMARDGYFDDVDAAFTWHPMDRNEAWSSGSLANISVIFHFKGTTAHAAASPHLGRSALDSVEIMNIGANYLREHIIPEARLHYAYVDVGGNAPNVVQGSASVHYLIRAPKVDAVLEIFERLKDVAKGAALINGTEHSYEVLTGLSDFIPNHVMTKVIHESMEEFGAPTFDEADFETAKKFFASLTESEQKIVETNLKQQHGIEKAKEILDRPLDTYIAPLNFAAPMLPGSTDVGDVSYVTPTAQFTLATTALGTSPHTWQMVAQGNTPMALKGVKAASGILALSAIKVLENPELAKQARKELNEVTGGTYTSLIPEDVKPNVAKK